MNSPKQCSLKGLSEPQPVGPSRIVLKLKGRIPSFKNNKMLIVKSPSGKLLPRPLLITKPEFQEEMRRMVASIELQLRSIFQTAVGQTCPESLIRSLTASCVPADDCWEMIPEIVIKGERCEAGQEGATIVIERL